MLIISKMPSVVLKHHMIYKKNQDLNKFDRIINYKICFIYTTI